MKKVLRGLLTGVAPIIATALGGSLAGTAVRKVAEALGLDPEAADVEELIAAKLETATAADWLAIRKADQDFKLEMRRLDVSERDLDRMDRDSARKMRVTLKDRFPNVLAIVIFAIFAVSVWFVFRMVMGETELNADSKDILVFLLGMISSQLLQVSNFYFGSSKGSQEKTQILSNGTSNRS